MRLHTLVSHAPSALAALVLVAAGGRLSGPSPLAAQERDTTIVVREAPGDGDVDVPDLDGPVTPGGAFLRAVLLPGWGHASIGSWNRAAFYFLAEAGSAWMLVRTRNRLQAAERVVALRESEVEAGLRARGVTDPDSILDAQDADPAVDDARDLVEARDQQWEDWLAVGIFSVLIAGVDALVSAHLQDFPEPLAFRPGPGPGTVDVAVRVPLSLLTKGR